MPKYFASFLGRQAGAIGAFMRWRIFVEGADPNAARLALYDTHEHISDLRLSELPIRYVATYINRDGLRTLCQAAQGRYTYATPQEAVDWIAAVRTNNDLETLAQTFGTDSFAVRPVHCWPGHFDPIGIYFDTDAGSPGEVAQ